MTAASPIGAHSNFEHGKDQRLWQTELALFGSVRYSGIWPGVELIYKADQSSLKGGVSGCARGLP
jgi:hypothetical protein